MRKSVNSRAVVNQQRVLRAGDTLLLLVPDSWVQAQRLGNSFALLGRVARYTPAAGAKDGDIGGGGGEGEGSGGGGGGDGDGSTERRLKLGASALALLLLLSLSSLSIVSLFPHAVTLSYFLVGAGCITPGQAWRSIGYRLILTIACSFGVWSGPRPDQHRRLRRHRRRARRAAGARPVGIPPVHLPRHASALVPHLQLSHRVRRLRRAREGHPDGWAPFLGLERWALG